MIRLHKHEFIIGPLLDSFSLFSSFQHSCQYRGYIKFANVRIRTTDRWCQKLPLYQLSHNNDNELTVAFEHFQLAQLLPMEENFLLLFRFDNPLESSVEFMKVKQNKLDHFGKESETK